MLLAQDYVKWRGHLFHRFLRALVDDSARVRSLAEYLLADTLSTKVESSPPCATHMSSLNPRSPAALRWLHMSLMEIMWEARQDCSPEV